MSLRNRKFYVDLTEKDMTELVKTCQNIRVDLDKATKKNKKIAKINREVLSKLMDYVEDKI